MNIYKFKTTVNCGGCVAKVTPHLNDNPGIETWSVDIASPDKILTVETRQLKKEEVKVLLERLGFRADVIE